MAMEIGKIPDIFRVPKVVWYYQDKKWILLWVKGERVDSYRYLYR